MKILIAEDDSVTRKLLEASLTKWGFEVISAADGNEALAILESDESINIAILDWMMPGREGVYICNQMQDKRNDRIIYIILLTARGGTADVVTGLASGAADYVVKPFKPAELRQRVLAGERIVHLEISLREKIDELQESLDKVNKLEKIIPICAWCKKVRSDDEYWENVETYLKQYTNTTVTHGVCPECREKILNSDDILDPKSTPAPK